MAIYLPDGTYKMLNVNSWTTAKDLHSMVAETLNIRFARPFGLYEIASNEEERRIEPTERILDMYALWQRMQTEQKSKLRRSSDKVLDYNIEFKVELYVDLDEDQVEEISMMYMQARAPNFSMPSFLGCQRCHDRAVHV